MILRGAIFCVLVSVGAYGNPKEDSLKLSSSTPVVSCFQRPKFFEINYRTLPAVKEYPLEDTGGEYDFEANRLIESKLSAPIVLKSKFKLVSQLRYKNETLNLGENDYYEKEVKLHNSSLTLLYQWFYKEDHFVAGHISGALKADRYDVHYFSSLLDYSTSVLIGQEKGERTVGVGAMYSNSLGRHRFYPVVVYQNRFGANWHIDAYLPKELTISRVLVPDDFYLTLAVEGSGASYFLHDSTLDEFPAVEFRRRAVDLKLGLEKEVYDWLWFGMYAGASQPLRTILIENGKPSRKYLHDFDQKISPFVNFSLFLVPPRKLYNRLTQ